MADPALGRGAEELWSSMDRRGDEGEDERR
jgi:hypothetical protein